MGWTPEQERAIRERNCNLLVAAAAGAGKTAVLVERIIQRIMDEEHPVDIDRLLVVTFTNAAAAEMRERIGEALWKAQQIEGNRRLQQQLTLLNKASITTIHSFCLEVIRNHFHRIDLDPGFRIADETETVLLKTEALEELFESRYEDGIFTDAFAQLVESYGSSRDDGALQEMVLSIYEFVQSHPWPETWLNHALQPFQMQEGDDFGRTGYARVLKTSLAIELQGLLNAMEQAVFMLQDAKGLTAYLPVFHEDVATLKQLVQCCKDPDLTWDILYQSFSTIAFSRLPSCKEADKTVQEQVKKVRDEAKSRLNKLKNDVLYGSSSEIAAELNDLYPMLECLTQLVKDFEVLYSAKKKEKGIVDFNDLEHYCLEILLEAGADDKMQPSEAARLLRDHFEEIFIDEYQDSNMVQEEILNAVARGTVGQPNLFMVGDVKQSIYRFRQAMPELFMEKYGRYCGEADSQKSDRKILLFKNFRSRPEVINAVNFVFGQIMSVNIGELDYNGDEALNPGASYADHEAETDVAGGPVELHVIEMDKEQDTLDEINSDEDDNENPGGTEEATEPPDLIKTEAGIVIRRIKELMTPDEQGRLFKVYDKATGQYRPLEYKDIVILMRATRNWAEVFAEEMALQGIPAYADAGSGYFQTIEVTTVLSLLQVIDNPMQDIPLLAVLRSPMASFTPDELLDIRLGNGEEAPVMKEHNFYEALNQASKGSGLLAEKAAAFLRQLRCWREKARHMATDQLLWYLYQETGYFSYVGVLPGGIQRQANLRILLERARQYEETSYKGLFNFIHFIQRLKGSKGDMGSAKTLAENDNVVRIMSIHKSKGLEFPVVFLSGTGKGFNMMDMNRRIIFHQELGFGPDYVDCRRRLTYTTIPKHALRFKIKLESLSEEMRILYVAFTRAREKLIITGSVRNLEKASAKWMNCLGTQGLKLPEYEMLKAKCYLDWIGAALIRHEGKALLQQVGKIETSEAVSYISDSSAWQVRVWHIADVLAGKSLEEKVRTDFLTELHTLLDGQSERVRDEEISRRLGWEYPYKHAERMPVKLTVTELKRRYSTEFAEAGEFDLYVPSLIQKPAFMEEEEGFSAAEKGTILHFVMQHLDLARVNNKREIQDQINEMVLSELITQSEAETVRPEKIMAFFESPLGQRMRCADRVYREVPFNVEISCSEIDSNPSGECYDGNILLQGVIDCYFIEGGRLVLLDYKTDAIKDTGGTARVEAIIREKYATQIHYYQKALELVTGSRVEEKYIYLFYNGEVVGFE